MSYKTTYGGKLFMMGNLQAPVGQFFSGLSVLIDFLAKLKQGCKWKSQREGVWPDSIRISIHFEFGAIQFQFNPTYFKFDSFQFEYGPIRFKFGPFQFEYGPIL